MDDVRAVMDVVGIEQAALLVVPRPAPSCFATDPGPAAPVLVNAMVKWSATDDFPWAYTPDAIGSQLDYVRNRWGSGLAGEAWFAPSLAVTHGRGPGWRPWSALGYSNAVATLFAMNGLIDIRPTLPAVSAPTLVIQRVAAIRN
jgi:hypothetical protein